MIQEEYLLDLLFSSKAKLQTIITVLNNLEDEVLNTPFGLVDDTFLIGLAKKNRIHLVRYLTLRPGIDLDKRNTSSYKDNALSWAVFLGHEQVVKILVESGCDIQMQTRISGKSLMYWSYSQRHYGVFKYLLINGCILTAVDYYGESILDRLPADSAYLDLIRSYKNVLKKILRYWFYRQINQYERGLVPLILTYYPGNA